MFFFFQWSSTLQRVVSLLYSSSLLTRRFLHLHSRSAPSMRRKTTSQPFTGGPALCFVLYFIFPLIHYIFNLLLSSAAAFGVKDYRGQIVNAGGLELQRESRGFNFA